MKRPFYKTLYFRVLVGIAVGVLLGLVSPHKGVAMKPFADGFIKLIRMLIAPVIFFTIVLGIAGVGDLKRLGRVGLKAILYFEVVSTLALGIGLVIANVFHPGRGLNINPASLNTADIAQYTSPSAHPTVIGFLLNILPDSSLRYVTTSARTCSPSCWARRSSAASPARRRCCTPANSRFCTSSRGFCSWARRSSASRGRCPVGCAAAPSKMRRCLMWSRT